MFNETEGMSCSKSVLLLPACDGVGPCFAVGALRLGIVRRTQSTTDVFMKKKTFDSMACHIHFVLKLNC